MQTHIFKIYTPLGERSPINKPIIYGFGRTEQSIVTVCRSAVLAPGLFIVARLAQALPVALVPKHILITSVRSDVVNDCCRGVSSLLQALGTERMLLKVSLADLLPCGGVAALACCPSVFGMHRLMLSTILLSVFNKHSAAGMLARSLRSVRHFNSSP